MPATKTKAGRSIGAQVTQLVAETLARWRGWAADLAAGRPGPDAAAVLEVARILEIHDAGRTLEADAAVLRELEAAEARVARERAAIEESVAPYGGEAGLAQEIQRRRDELRQLEGAASPWRWMSIGHANGRIGRLRKANPRLFDA